MKPLAPVKPQEKLPVTYHLSIVPAPQKMYAVTLTQMQGDEVLRRRVLAHEATMDLALDEIGRKATRVFYFGEGPEWIEQGEGP